MAYVKKYATEEERRLAKSIAGKKGAEALKKSGNFRGGRKKGGHNRTTNASHAEPTRSILVRESAYNVFVKCATFINKPQVEFMSMVAKGLKERNPQLFELRDNVIV